jgi:hypothetical protein
LILGLSHRLVDGLPHGMTNTPTNNRAESFLSSRKNTYSRRWS